MTDLQQLKQHLFVLQKTTLVDLLTDIARHLTFDSAGNFAPEESTAAHSGGDFVNEVGYFFEIHGVTLAPAATTEFDAGNNDAK